MSLARLAFLLPTTCQSQLLLGSLVTLYLQMCLHSEYLIFSYPLSTLRTFPSPRRMIFHVTLKWMLFRWACLFAVQISVYHPVFTSSICGVHQHHTTSCRHSCRVLKDWKALVFGAVLDFCWIKLPYEYSHFLWVVFLGEFNTSISNYFNARLISLIITAGYIYIRNKYRSVNQNTWCWGLCSATMWVLCVWFV